MRSIQDDLIEAAINFFDDYSIPLIKAALYCDVNDLIEIGSKMEEDLEQIKKNLKEEYVEDLELVSDLATIKSLERNRGVLFEELKRSIATEGIKFELIEAIKNLPIHFVDYHQTQYPAKAFVLFMECPLFSKYKKYILANLDSLTIRGIVNESRRSAREGDDFTQSIAILESVLILRMTELRPLQIQEKLANFIAYGDEEGVRSFCQDCKEKLVLSFGAEESVFPPLEREINNLIEKMTYGADPTNATLFGVIICAKINQFDKIIHSTDSVKISRIIANCKSEIRHHEDEYSKILDSVVKELSSILIDRNKEKQAKYKRAAAFDDASDDDIDAPRSLKSSKVSKPSFSEVPSSAKVSNKADINAHFFSGRVELEGNRGAAILGRKILKKPGVTATVVPAPLSSSPALFPSAPSEPAKPVNPIMGAQKLFGPGAHKPLSPESLLPHSQYFETIFGVPVRPKRVITMPQASEIKPITQESAEDATDSVADIIKDSERAVGPVIKLASSPSQISDGSKKETTI
jgi:hypothetical protein